MDTVRLALEAAWKVLYTGLLLGAGLPVMFALGVRLLSGPAAETEGEVAVEHRPSAVNRVLAWLCFAVVAYGVLVGLLVIIGAGQGKIVSFEHVFPTLVPK
jgi:hypothetical protein